MRTLVGQIRLETKLLFRDKRSLFLTLAFPVIMILIFGSVFSGQNWSGIPAINYLLPGMIVMALMMACMNNNAVKITND
jgi:ABC-2 type transport system permease protein